jgi:nicotinamidase-related amidase
MEKLFLNKKDAVLVIVDVQQRLASAMKHRARVAENIQHLIEAAKLLDFPAMVTEQYPKGLGPTIDEIRGALPAYNPLEKMTFDCCGDKAFVDEVAAMKRSKIILTGMETHVCVLQTCLSLLHKGYGVHVVQDAVCSRTRENYRTGLELMRDGGAVITCTETVLFQLMEKAATPEFKALSKRIK